MDQDAFIKRLVELRQNQNVSARDMSLSLGQSAGYINNIENGKNYPSLLMFFYMCEFLEITPEEFFRVDVTNPPKLRALTHEAQRLTGEQLDHLIALAKEMK